MKGFRLQASGFGLLAACGAVHAKDPPRAIAIDAGVASSVRTEGAITFDGVPPLDAAIAAKLAPYLAAPDVALADYDGAMLVATQAGDTVQLARLDAPGHLPAQLTHGDGPIAYGRWDDGAVVTIADHDGDELFQIADGDTLLTDGKSRNLAPLWTSDGRTMAFASTARDGVDTDLWWSDGETASSAKLLYQASGTWAPIGFSSDDKTLLAIARASSERTVLESLDLQTGKARALSDDGDATTDARFGGKGTIYAISDRDVKGKTRRPRLWELASGAWQCLSCTIDADVETFDVGAHSVAFTADVAGASQLWLWDVKKRALHRASGAPDSAVIASLRFADDRDVLALGWSTATTPGQVGLYDPAKPKLTAWTSGATPGIDASRLVAPNHALAGTVPVAIYSPAPGASSGRAPVVIVLHGGPEDQARPRWQPEVQFLLALGFAVVEPDVRGSTGYGRAYQAADDGANRSGAIDDVGAVLDWIATQPDLDPSRVSVLGASYGGWLALASAARYGDRLRACVDLWGMPDLATFLAGTAPWRRADRAAEYGDAPPTFDPKAITIPLLVAAGAHDPRVPDALAVHTSGPVWSLSAADEGHGWQRSGNRAALWTAIAMLLSSATR